MLRGKKKVEESGKEIENVDPVKQEREHPSIQVKRVCKGERFHYLCFMLQRRQICGKQRRDH